MYNKHTCIMYLFKYSMTILYKASHTIHKADLHYFPKRVEVHEVWSLFPGEHWPIERIDWVEIRGWIEPRNCFPSLVSAHFFPSPHNFRLWRYLYAETSFHLRIVLRTYYRQGALTNCEPLYCL